MIKVIEEKRYNTETAELVFKWTNGMVGTFQYREKELYRTKKGTGSFIIMVGQ
jgi:hypothetical protein